MIELPLAYIKEMASQIIFISVFLGGFSATILGTLILSQNSNKILKKLIVSTSLSAMSFIVTVFTMVQLTMLSIPGYPIETSYEDIMLPRIIGIVAFFIGLLSLIFVVSISGWLQSRKLGIVTTTIGIIGLILVLISTVSIKG